MTDEAPRSELILYETEDGRTRIECREHLGHIYEEGELEAATTIRKFRIVRSEGNRRFFREIDHYNLDAVLAVAVQRPLT